MSSKIAKKILEHPDHDEIMTKLISDTPSSDINEWLEAKYSSVDEAKFVLSVKDVNIFRKDYLDIVTMVRQDLNKSKSNKNYEEDMREEIQGTPAYHKLLEKHASDEVDIKNTVKRMVLAIEQRASQVFDQIQEDPRNVRMDRTLIEWFNALTGLLEKYDTILNGNPDQINIQNNINIQVVDKHINVVYDLIIKILEKLDYDTSLMFIEMFNDAMKNLQSSENRDILPIDKRLSEAKILNDTLQAKLDK